jgi:hypothetical protein
MVAKRTVGVVKLLLAYCLSSYTNTLLCALLKRLYKIPSYVVGTADYDTRVKKFLPSKIILQHSSTLSTTCGERLSRISSSRGIGLTWAGTKAYQPILEGKAPN